jgi:hypothetical protein
VTGARPTKWRLLYGLGVRITRKTLAYIGSYEGAVEIRLRTPRRFPVPFGLTITRPSVTVALLDPTAFIAELERRLS